MTDTAELVTTTEAAAICGATRSTFAAWAKKHDIRPIVVGKGGTPGVQSLYDRDDIERAAAKRPWCRVPNGAGGRVIAKTCGRCGELKDADAFHIRGTTRVSYCRDCHWSLLHTGAARVQSESRDTAHRNGYQWTGPELELVASRPDLSDAELAKMLGRTRRAVTQARYLVRHEPKKCAVAGATS